MNQTFAFITNMVTGIFANIGQNRYATDSMKIEHEAVYVQESSVSIQPQVMAAASLVLIVVLIVVSRSK